MSRKLVLLNGKIRTMNPERPQVDAIAIRGSKIIAIGKNAEMRAISDPTWRVIDLEGHLVLPGLIDSHIHLGQYARRCLIELDLAGIDNLDRALYLIHNKIEETETGNWILGGGWDKNLWDDAIIDKHKLDKLSDEHPIALWSKDYHTLWLNSYALKKFNINRNTKAPEGGKFGLMDDGEPNGILYEKAAVIYYKKIAKPLLDNYKNIIKEGINILHRLGITSIHNLEEQEEFTVFQELDKENDLRLRVVNMLSLDMLDDAIRIGLRSNFGNHHLRIGNVKLFMDGTLGSQTAYMLKPYTATENTGLPILTKDKLNKLVNKAISNGIGVAIHSIGDRANREVLTAFEKAQKENHHNNIVYRIEHAQLLHPEDIPRFNQLGVYVAMQPIHAISDMKVAEHHWGKERCKGAYAWRSLLDSGATLVFGSDAPIESPNPFLGIYAALTRKNPNYSSSSWIPEECITIEEALYAYTLGGAYASGQEACIGSLVPGKLADLIVLDRNILDISAEEILKTQVLATIIDGDVVYISNEKLSLKDGENGENK